MYELRKYQKNAVEAGVAYFNDPKAKGGAIEILPTGAGKSLVIANIARSLEGRTLVLQPSVEILEQNLKKIHEYGYTDTGVFSASLKRKDFGQITFGTIGSVHRQKERFSDFDRVIVDECHNVKTTRVKKGQEETTQLGMYEDLFAHMGGKVLGLTATAFRLRSYEDKQSGERVVVAQMLHRTRPRTFSKVIHITQIKELYDGGFLCPVQYHKGDKYKHSDLTLNSTGMDFNKDELREYNQRMNVVGEVEKSIATLNAKHVLVFCVFVEEAQKLAQALEARGIRSESISTGTKPKDRKRILQEFKAGDIQVVTNVGVLTEGFDFPELDCVVLARPTQSVALYYQMAGRGIRTAEGKPFVNVVDVCGNVDRFGEIETFEYVEPKPNLHRLRSNVSFLTGFDFKNNQDLEERGYEGLRDTTGENNTKIWYIGKKHKGKHIARLPSQYLEWVIGEFSDGKAKDMAIAELERRRLKDAQKTGQMSF